jgi:hypothetical protein
MVEQEQQTKDLQVEDQLIGLEILLYKPAAEAVQVHRVGTVALQLPVPEVMEYLQLLRVWQ